MFEVLIAVNCFAFFGGADRRFVFVRTVDYQLGQAPLLYHCLK
jgi:hypothetical protein